MSRQRSGELRRGVLGVPAIAFFVISANGPMAAVFGATPLVLIFLGVGGPGIYVLSALLFVVFSAGYVAMSRHIGNAAGFVTYIARGFDVRVGAAASLTAVFTYLATISAIWVAYALFAQQTFADKFGVNISWQVWALGTVAVVAFLTYNKIELSVRILGPLMILECLVILVLDIAVIVSGGSGGSTGLSFSGFEPSNVFVSGFGVALLFGIVTFGGFEATVVFSEEAKDPRRTIPRAVYFVIAFIGGFYALSCWALVNAVGPDRIQEVAAQDPTGFIFAVADQYIGPAWSDIMSVLVVTSFFAILLGFTNILGRYVFALARAGILPSSLSATHPGHQSPHLATLVTCATVAVVIGAFIVAGADPFVWAYTFVLALGTVGMLTMLCTTSLAVMVYFLRRGRGDDGVWQTRIAPCIATGGFAATLYLAIANWDVLTSGLKGVASWMWLLVPAIAIIGYGLGVVREKNLDFRHGVLAAEDAAIDPDPQPVEQSAASVAVE